MTNVKLTLSVFLISLSVFSSPLFADPVSQSSSMVVSDTDISANILKKIANNPSVSSLIIKVNSVNGLVTLVGTVDSGQQAGTLVELAEETAGVKDIDVSNLLTSNNNQPASKAFSDAVITAKVQGTFLREKLFDVEKVADMPIQLEATDGVVYLTGFADNVDEVNRAISIAKSVSGVMGVTSKIIIRPR